MCLCTGVRVERMENSQTEQPLLRTAFLQGFLEDFFGFPCCYPIKLCVRRLIGAVSQKMNHFVAFTPLAPNLRNIQFSKIENDTRMQYCTANIIVYDYVSRPRRDYGNFL